jgi:hypothetical protein
VAGLPRSRRTTCQLARALIRQPEETRSIGASDTVLAPDTSLFIEDARLRRGMNRSRLPDETTRHARGSARVVSPVRARAATTSEPTISAVRWRRRAAQQRQSCHLQESHGCLPARKAAEAAHGKSSSRTRGVKGLTHHNAWWTPATQVVFEQGKVGRQTLILAALSARLASSPG